MEQSMKSKLLKVIFVCLLAAIVMRVTYRLGYLSVADRNAIATIPVLHLKVLSTRLNGTYLMVRDEDNGLVGELASYGYEGIKVEDGDSIDVELWHQPDSYTTDFVFKGDSVRPEVSYHEADYSHAFQNAEIDKH
jgi:hypothetical protein